MSVFPFLAAPAVKPLSPPLYEEWAFDFETGRLIVADGQMYKVTGQEALKVWMYKSLCTAKGRFRAYSASFGSELEDLIGTYSPAAVRTEAQRMVAEALMASPYISAVSSVEASINGGLLAIKCSVATVYGTTSLEVTV